jgi:hypothetical protein
MSNYTCNISANENFVSNNSNIGNSSNAMNPNLSGENAVNMQGKASGASGSSGSSGVRTKNSINGGFQSLNSENEMEQNMNNGENPAEGEIILYENCNFSGKSKKFGMGNVTFVGTDFDDLTSSIKIGAYTSLTIYTDSDFTGNNLSWKNDTNAVFLINCLTANNFNKMLSSMKISSSAPQASNNLSPQAKPVSILGQYNISPWNLDSSKFVDTSAQWIWTSQWCNKTCSGSAPIDTNPVKFQLLVPNTTPREIPVIVHVIADNAPQGANFVKLNGSYIGQIIDNGWVATQYSKIEGTLQPGTNLLEFEVKNVGGSAGLIVSVINANTNQVIVNSGSGKWGWVPATVISTTNTEHSIILKDATKKVSAFSNINDITAMTVGGTFRLRVSLKNVPPYITGQEYKEGTTNDFYLSVEKLEPNCNINGNNGCLSIYVDNKNCNNAILSNVSRTNPYRLVLVSKTYVDNASNPMGKNVDFTMIKVGDKVYIKNIQTGYMPQLFTNNFKQNVYGYMDDNQLSNLSTIKSTTNTLCGAKPDTEVQVSPVSPVAPATTQTESQNIFSKAISGIFGTNQPPAPTPPPVPKTPQQFITCAINADGNMYFMTTKNIAESNPIKFVLNKDGTVSFRLQTYNSYGNTNKTYSFVFCNFNINTRAFIEKITNPTGNYFVNMVCFDPDDKRKLPNNTLNFHFEISKYPENYLKDKNISTSNT